MSYIRSFVSEDVYDGEYTRWEMQIRGPIQERKRMKPKATKQIRKIPSGGNSDKLASLSESESETQKKLSEATTTCTTTTNSSMHKQDLQTAAAPIILEDVIPPQASFKKKKLVVIKGKAK